jgi:hypothetical protein
MKTVRYLRNLTHLYLTKRIAWSTVLYAIRERPIAIAGRQGAWIVDPDFDR